ncbi:hypothetical protein EAG_12055 [Camponotus floridanus]|uniref:Uncharacterized protein n=1 Tax=Camponotus floridanus TaxID=104421 RepID=E2AS49_CAMFO|nr:hypothetical protein EAG_12055 [Camponotus floridanus]
MLLRRSRQQARRGYEPESWKKIVEKGRNITQFYDDINLWDEPENPNSSHRRHSFSNSDSPTMAMTTRNSSRKKGNVVQKCFSSGRFLRRLFLNPPTFRYSPDVPRGPFILQRDPYGPSVYFVTLSSSSRCANNSGKSKKRRVAIAQAKRKGHSERICRQP